MSSHHLFVGICHSLALLEGKGMLWICCLSSFCVCIDAVAIVVCVGMSMMLFLAFSLIATSHPPALHSNRVRLCRKGVLPRDKSGLCLWLLEVTSRSLFTLQGMGLGAHWMVCANNVTFDKGFGSSACPSLWAGDYGQSCL